MKPQMRALIEAEWWDHFQPEDGNPTNGDLERERNPEYFEELLATQVDEVKVKRLLEQSPANLRWES